MTYTNSPLRPRLDAEAAQATLQQWLSDEDAARTQLLTIFEAMGPTDPRTIEARRKLSGLLFS